MSQRDAIGPVQGGGHGRPGNAGGGPRQGAPTAGEGVNSTSEYKNHGQMVSAAARQGIHGRELSTIARGETSLEELLARREADIRQAEAGQSTTSAVDVDPTQIIEVVQPNAPQPAPAVPTPWEAIGADQQALDSVATEFFRQSSAHFRRLGGA
ncbi:MAG: hypothetical protein AMXMBFR33_25690 [Candidatus Xenobia bacterium]